MRRITLIIGGMVLGVAMIAIIALQREETAAVTPEPTVATNCEAREGAAPSVAPPVDPARTAIAGTATKRTGVGAAPPSAARSGAPAGRLVVTAVDDSTGTRVPNVRVTLARCPFGRDDLVLPDSVIGSRTTNADGEARIDADRGIELVVRVDRPHFAKSAYVTLEAGTQHDLVMRVFRGARLTGSVVTRAGAPLSSALVSIIERRSDASESMIPFPAITQSDGRFVIEAFPVRVGSTYAARARADGYAEAFVDGVAPVAGETVELPPIVLDVGGIAIVGTLVADQFDVAGKTLLLVQGGFIRSAELASDGAFEFRVPTPGEYRLEFENSCLDGQGERKLSVPTGTQRFDCGVVRVSSPSAHLTGRVVASDGATPISGTVRFGKFESQIEEDGSFDLETCASGPLPLDISWSTGLPCSRELVPDFIFPSMTGNELRVQPRGILVQIVRNGILSRIDRRVLVNVQGDGFGCSSPMDSMDASWRVPEVPAPGSRGTPGVATVTITVEGEAAVMKTIRIGDEKFRCPEVVVTFDYAELGLE